MYKLASINKNRNCSSMGNFFLNKIKTFPKVLKERIDSLPDEYKLMTLGKDASYVSIKFSSTMYSNRTLPEDVETIAKLTNDTDNDIVIINLNEYDNYYGHKKYGSIGIEAVFYDKDFNPIPMYDTIEIIFPLYPAIEKYTKYTRIIPAMWNDDDSWFDIDNDNFPKGTVAANHPYLTALFDCETFIVLERTEYIKNIQSNIASFAEISINARRTVFPVLPFATFVVDLT